MKIANINMTHHEKNFCAVIMKISALQTEVKEREAMEYVRRKEFAYVGAGIGGVFQNTKELHVMKSKWAMATNDKDCWKVLVEEERKNMDKYAVWMKRKL